MSKFEYLSIPFIGFKYVYSDGSSSTRYFCMLSISFIGFKRYNIKPEDICLFSCACSDVLEFMNPTNGIER